MILFIYFYRMLLMIFISYIMTFMGLISSPLLGSIVLILLSAAMGVFISLLASKWMSYLVILLFLGGMMILFIYICTLISNLKSFVKNSYDFMFFPMMVSFMLSNMVYFQYWDLNFEIKQSTISILYMKSNFLLISMCVIYLLLVLMISVKLSQKFKGSLKAKMYEF